MKITETTVEVKFGHYSGEGFSHTIKDLKEAVTFIAQTQSIEALQDLVQKIAWFSWAIKEGKKPDYIPLVPAVSKVNYQLTTPFEVFEIVWKSFLQDVAAGNGERDFYNLLRECVAILENRLFKLQHPEYDKKADEVTLDANPKARTGQWTMINGKKMDLLADGTLEEVLL